MPSGHEAPAGASLPALLPGIAALVVLAAVNGIARIVRDAQQRVLAIKVEREALGQVLGVTACAEPYQFEDPDFHNRVERALFASRTKPLTLLFTALSLLQAVLSTVAVADVFATMVWWLAPLLVVATVPTVRTAKRVRQAQYEVHRELAENLRAREYLSRLVTGRREAQEVHAMGLGPLLLQRCRARYEQDVDRQTQLTRLLLWRQLAARGLSDVIVAVALGGRAVAAYTEWISLPTALTAVAGLWMLSTQVRNAGAMVASTGDTVLYINDLRSLTSQNAPPPPPPPPPAPGRRPRPRLRHRPGQGVRRWHRPLGRTVATPRPGPRVLPRRAAGRARRADSLARPAGRSPPSRPRPSTVHRPYRAPHLASPAQRARRRPHLRPRPRHHHRARHSRRTDRPRRPVRQPLPHPGGRLPHRTTATRSISHPERDCPISGLTDDSGGPPTQLGRQWNAKCCLPQDERDRKGIPVGGELVTERAKNRVPGG